MPKNGRGDETLRRDDERKVRVRFLVRGRREVAGVACHEVIATSAAAPDEETVLLVRVEDLSLKSLETRQRSTKSTISTIANDRAPFVQLATSSLCPWDLPLFPREAKSEEREFDLGEGRKVVQKLTLAKDGSGCTVELTTRWRGEKLVTTQLWKRGLPFWSSCTRTLDGVKDEWASLDEGSVKPAK